MTKASDVGMEVVGTPSFPLFSCVLCTLFQDRQPVDTDQNLQGSSHLLIGDSLAVTSSGTGGFQQDSSINLAFCKLSSSWVAIGTQEIAEQIPMLCTERTRKVCQQNIRKNARTAAGEMPQ